MSRVISAQRLGNGRTVATAMPPNIRQDNSQDNLRRTWTRNVRAGNLRDNSQLGHATAAKHLREMTRQNPAVMFLTIPF
jgi:hypothetical protein